MLQFDEGFVSAWMKHLTPQERIRAVEVAVAAQTNRRSPGLHVEPIHKGRDTHLRSVRVNDDIRIIAVERGDQLIPLYVDHHEAAYRWAAGRRAMSDAETNVITIQHIVSEGVPTATFAVQLPQGMFDNYEDKYLVGLGVPEDFIPTLRHVRTDDDLLNVLDGLTGDFVNCLLNLASGTLPRPSLAPIAVDTTPTTAASDAAFSDLSAVSRQERYEPLRLFDVDDADLRRMLAAPSQEAWIAFLHPSQRGVATRCFRGPAQVVGGAGTGKTVVAMHRARHLARQGRKVLLTSFTNNARMVLERGVRLICDPGELRRITTQTVHATARTIVRRVEDVQPPKPGEIRELLTKFSAQSGVDAILAEAEWQLVIQALGITRWEDYRDARRTGRGTRLSIADRERLWDEVIVPLDREMKARGILDWADICQWARRLVEAGIVPSPFDAVIVDETQDLGPQELRLLVALSGSEDDNLTLVGDSGQRIYPNRIRLRDLGIDTRGRSRVLTLNYRTTREIRDFAERLLGNMIDDLDGGHVRRGAVYSLFTGPEPILRGFTDETEQYAFLTAALKQREAAGMPLHEIVVLAPTNAIAQTARSALMRENIPCHETGRSHRAPQGCVAVSTIHGAKGLEYRVVFVVGVSDDILTHLLPADAEERAMTLEQQRNLLYVAVTRAREELILCWTGTPSRFLPNGEAGPQQTRDP